MLSSQAAPTDTPPPPPKSLPYLNMLRPIHPTHPAKMPDLTAPSQLVMSQAARQCPARQPPQTHLLPPVPNPLITQPQPNHANAPHPTLPTRAMPYVWSLLSS